jgi:hypothetical protein
MGGWVDGCARLDMNGILMFLNMMWIDGWMGGFIGGWVDSLVDGWIDEPGWTCAAYSCF